ncbi:hypothetical protein [Streptomyces bluensis]|uniref:HK97 gp10 family phage protein n=1 Tax=Streptomyces bluensis TaxID=33897 RepID=A0ABW6UWN7_9ACTN
MSNATSVKVNHPLTPAMRKALTEAAARWDRSLIDVDGRTLRGLIQRGLVDVTMGTNSYHRGNGHWVTKSVIVDVKINDAGRTALAAKETQPRTLRRDSLGYGYVTSDGRYEVTPAYSPTHLGGSASRPSYWILTDRQGEFEPRTQLTLSRIRDTLKERP